LGERGFTSLSIGVIKLLQQAIFIQYELVSPVWELASKQLLVFQHPRVIRIEYLDKPLSIFK